MRNELEPQTTASLQEHIFKFLNLGLVTELSCLFCLVSVGLSGLIPLISQFICSEGLKWPFPFCGVIALLLRGCMDPEE